MESDEFDLVGIGSSVWIRDRQGLAFLQENLSKILQGACDHQPGVGQVETLRDGSRKIEVLRNYHFAGRAWKVEGKVVAEHEAIMPAQG